MGYAEFFLAGMLAMTTFGIAMNTSWGIFMDKDSGIFYELLTYPITRRQFLVGKICFNVPLSAAGGLLAIILATWTMEVTVRWVWAPITLLVVMGTTAGWFFLFYPMDQLPTWFRTLAWLNPMTWQVDVLRFTLLGSGRSRPCLWKARDFLHHADLSGLGGEDDRSRRMNRTCRRHSLAIKQSRFFDRDFKWLDALLCWRTHGARKSLSPLSHRTGAPETIK